MGNPEPGVFRSRLALARVVSFCAWMVLVGGCSDGKNADDDREHHHHHHEHPTVGPNKGAIIEWGAHVHHLEITFDRDTQQATVYVLDHDVKKPEAIAATKTMVKLDRVEEPIELKPSPLPGEGEGRASRYVAAHPALGGAETFKGAVSGVVAGKTYLGTFEEADAESAKKPAPHDDHDGHEDGHADGQK